MRTLTSVETHVIQWFADHVGKTRSLSLLEDLEDTMVEEIRDEGLTLRFHKAGDLTDRFIDSYVGGFATARDGDGANLGLTLWRNLDGSPFELQVRRLEGGPVHGPDWASLSGVPPKEVDPPL